MQSETNPSFSLSLTLCHLSRLFPDGVNLVLDYLSGDINKGFGLLKALGHYVLYGSSSNSGLINNLTKTLWSSDKIKPVKLFENNATISGFSLRQFLYQQDGHQHVRSTVEKVYALYLDGKIKPTIDSRFAFENVNEAMARLHERQNVGKVVLDVNLQPIEEEPQPVKRASRFSTKNLLKKSEKKEAAKEEAKDEKKNGDEKPAEEKPAEESAESKPVENKPEETVTNGEKAVEA